MADPYYCRRYRDLLARGAFERRANGWRFGTKRITDDVVARLVAAGYARRDGNHIILANPEAAS